MYNLKTMSIFDVDKNIKSQHANMGMKIMVEIAVRVHSVSVYRGVDLERRTVYIDRDYF